MAKQPSLAHLLHAFRADLVQRIRRSVVIGVIRTVVEIDDVNARDSGIQKWEVIVPNRRLDRESMDSSPIRCAVSQNQIHQPLGGIGFVPRYPDPYRRSYRAESGHVFSAPRPPFSIVEPGAGCHRCCQMCSIPQTLLRRPKTQTSSPGIFAFGQHSRQFKQQACAAAGVVGADEIFPFHQLGIVVARQGNHTPFSAFLSAQSGCAS